VNGENTFRAPLAAAPIEFAGILPTDHSLHLLPPSLLIAAPLVQVDLSIIPEIAPTNTDLFWPQTQSITAELSNITANQQARSLIGVDKLLADSRFSNLQGQSQTIAVIDTGINPQHSYFGIDADGNGIADRIIYQYDFADGDPDARDVNGHGSQTASIVGGEDVILPGIATAVNIISLKVFNNSGESDYRYVKQALDWVTFNADRYRIGTVLMALGNNQNFGAMDDRFQLSQTLSELADQGVIAVAATGNNFAQLKSQMGVSAPANDLNVVAVGAVYNSNLGKQEYYNGATAYTTDLDRITPFSQRNAQTIFAPGAPITGAGSIGNNLLTLQGSSQAAAYVAGAAVLAQQLANQYLGRSLTINEFRDLVQSTGQDLQDGDDENDNVINSGLGFKRLDLFELANKIWQQRDQGNEPQLSIATTQNLAWEQGAAGLITVSRSGDLSQSLNFNYRLSGTAQNGMDYLALNGAGVFKAGQSTAEIEVVAIDDNLAESGEIVTVSLVDRVGYQLTRVNSARVAIVDNDSIVGAAAAQVATAPSSTTVNERSWSTSVLTKSVVAADTNQSSLPMVETTPMVLAVDPLAIDYIIVDVTTVDWLSEEGLLGALADWTAL
jgi:Subtilase family/Calx-beta domain